MKKATFFKFIAVLCSLLITIPIVIVTATEYVEKPDVGTGIKINC
jgi:heat shock protein 5